MKRAMVNIVLAGMVVMLFVPVAVAGATKAGVTMVDSLKINGEKLVVNGLGVREATVFNVDVYVAGLYLKKKNSNPAAILLSPEPKFLFLRFVRNVSIDDIRDAWADGIRKNGGAGYSGKIVRLNSFMKKMNKGDSMAFTFTAGGVGVTVNGRYKGFVSGGRFARILLKIWFGPDPPNIGLKTGLLGK